MARRLFTTRLGIRNHASSRVGLIFIVVVPLLASSNFHQIIDGAFALPAEWFPIECDVVPNSNRTHWRIQLDSQRGIFWVYVAFHLPTTKPTFLVMSQRIDRGFRTDITGEIYHLVSLKRLQYTYWDPQLIGCGIRLGGTLRRNKRESSQPRGGDHKSEVAAPTAMAGTTRCRVIGPNDQLNYFVGDSVFRLSPKKTLGA